MSTFKQKTCKRRHETPEPVTIESKHKEIVQQISIQDENQYLMDTAPILTQYYQEKENPVSSLIVRKKDHTGPSVLDYLKPKAEVQQPQKPTINRNQLYNWYMTITDPSFLPTSKPTPLSDQQNDSWCNECQTATMQLDGMVVCPKCGSSQYALISADRPCFKEKQGQETMTSYTYKRINHFNEWISAFQAKETTVIPAEVLEKIHAELRKCKWKDLSTLTAADMRGILKKLKYNKYYEHIPHILCKVSGKQAPVISREKEEALRSRFEELQEPYQRHCPDSRNFLSYRFVLRKLFELEGLPQSQSEEFALPRSKKKIDEYNHIWELLCRDLGWPFILTVR